MTAVALATAAMAPTASAEDDPSYLSLGVGWFDLLDNREAVDLRAEYRSKIKLFGFIKPWVGVEVTSDSAAYGAIGILTDFHISRRMVLTPNFGGGLYADGDGKNLGNTVVFRSQIEIAYQFDDRSRLSFSFGHISNARLGTENPGSEIATIYYHFPLEKF